MYSPEVLRELALLRAKALDGSYTIEDGRRYVLLTRTHREAAPTATAAKKQRKAAVQVNVDALLESLKNISS